MIDKLLLYGNSFIAERCAFRLLALEDCAWPWELVGFVPCQNEPTIPGRMPNGLPEVDEGVAHDVKLSIQFDRRIVIDDRPAYNVHTGLLPHWGGCDILYHTLNEGASHQGITFHVMTNTLDSGPIVAQYVYPVLSGDDIVTLYLRLSDVCPGFVVNAMKLAHVLGWENARRCASMRPAMYARGEIHPDDRETYLKTPAIIRERLRR